MATVGIMRTTVSGGVNVSPPSAARILQRSIRVTPPCSCMQPGLDDLQLDVTDHSQGEENVCTVVGHQRQTKVVKKGEKRSKLMQG